MTPSCTYRTREPSVIKYPIKIKPSGDVLTILLPNDVPDSKLKLIRNDVGEGKHNMMTITPDETGTVNEQTHGCFLIDPNMKIYIKREKDVF